MSPLSIFLLAQNIWSNQCNLYTPRILSTLCSHQLTDSNNSTSLHSSFNSKQAHISIWSRSMQLVQFYLVHWPMSHHTLSSHIMLLHTPAADRATDRVISCVCDYVHVCVSVCPHSKRKTAWAINFEVGTDVVHGSR